MFSQFRRVLSPSVLHGPFQYSCLNHARSTNVIFTRNFAYEPNGTDTDEFNDNNSDDEFSQDRKDSFFQNGPQRRLKKKVPQGEVADTDLAESVQLVTDKDIQNVDKTGTSPEHDHKDQSVQWEKFDRSEMYKMLRHMEQQKTTGITKFSDQWVPPGAPENTEQDQQYSRHVQLKPKEIHNRSEDNQWGNRMASTRNLRMNPPIEFDQWADKLPEHIQTKYADSIAENKDEYAKRKVEWEAHHPPPMEGIVDPSRYGKFLLNPNDPEFKELYAGPHHSYTYEDWEAELRRSLLHNHVAGPIPEEAQLALDKYTALQKIQTEENVSPLLDKPKPANIKSTARYHDRMLRLYGQRYAPSEQFSVAESLQLNDVQTQLDQAVSAAYSRPDFGVDVEILLAGNETAAVSAAYSRPDFGVDVEILLAGNETAAGEQKSKGKDKEKGDDFHFADADGYEEEMTAADEARAEMADHQAGLKVKTHSKKTKNIPIDERTESQKLGYDYDKLVKNIAHDQTKQMDPWDPMGFQYYLEQRAKDDFSKDKGKGRFEPIESREEKLGDLQEYFLFNTREPGIDAEDTEVLDPHKQNHEYDMQEFYDNCDPRLRELLQLPTPAEETAPEDIQDRVKEAIYKLNFTDPVKYHSHRLASMFGLAISRIQAILRLKFIKYDLMKQDNFYEENRDLFHSNKAERDEYEMEGQWPLSKWHPEEYAFNKHPEQYVINEKDYILYKKIENARQARFWSVIDMKIRKEQANSLKEGKEGRPFGAPPARLPEPRAISDNVQHPLRYNLVLTDISEVKKNKYRVCVRDKSGVLREPNEEEFKRVRFREKPKKGYFHHVPYKIGETI